MIADKITIKIKNKKIKKTLKYKITPHQPKVEMQEKKNQPKN